MPDQSPNLQPAVSQPGMALGPLEGLLLGLMAGAVVWGLIQAIHPVFHVPEEFHVGMGAAPEAVAANRREQDRIDRQHAMLYIGSLGLVAGGLLGLREGILRRAWATPVAAAFLGTAGGVLGGLLGHLGYEYVRIHIGQAELTHTIGTQALMAVPLGLGLGLGLSRCSLGGALRGALAGVGAGILAAVIYPVVVSVLMPAVSTDALFPGEGSSRALWLGLLAGLMGLVIPIAGRRRTAGRTARETPASAGQSEPIASPP